MKRLLSFICSIIFLVLISACENYVQVGDGNKYNVTYISEYGKIENTTYISGTKFELGEVVLSEEETKLVTFVGWYTNPSFLGSSVKEIKSSEVGDKTFYAKFEPVKLEVGDLKVLESALKHNNSYTYTYYHSENTALPYEYTDVFDYYNGSLRYSYEYDGTNYIDYLIYDEKNDSYAFYYDDGEEYLIKYDTDEDFYWYVLEFSFAYLDAIDFNNYQVTSNPNVFECISTYLETEGNNILGGACDGETYTSIVITVENDYIKTIEVESMVENAEEGKYDSVTIISFANYDTISFKAPEGSVIEDGYISLEEFLTAEDGKEYSVCGYVTGYVGNSFYITDLEHGLYVYAGKLITDFKIGEKVSITGIKKTYNNLVEIADISVATSFNEFAEIESTTISSISEIDANLYRVIDIANLKLVNPVTISSISNDISVLITDGKMTTTLFISKYLDDSLKQEIVDILNSLNAIDKIDLKNVVASISKTSQIVITSESKIEKKATQVEIIVTGISTNRKEYTVVNGTSLEEAMEKVIVYKNYNNGESVEVDRKEYNYYASKYEEYLEGNYEVTITLDSFITTIIIKVLKDANSAFKPVSVPLLEDVAHANTLTRGMPSTGNSKALVIPIAFTDYPADPAMKHDLEITFFGTSEETGWESLSSYYTKASYGKLNITGDVLDPYQIGKPSTYYTKKYSTNENIDYEIIKSALEYYDSTINYADYDSDEDGYIDALYIIYSAPVNFQDSDTLWWAYTYEYFTDDVEVYDGVEADFYFFAGYEFIYETPACEKDIAYNAETFIHETGHILGLPDYYDYDSSAGPKGGLGGGDMMDYNVGDHNAFSKTILGWTTPYVYCGGEFNLDLKSFCSSGDCILIPKKWDNSYFSEYYIIDFFTPDGLNEFEKGNSGLFSKSGIRIFHIDATLKSNDLYGIWDIYEFDNSYTDHKLINLVQARGATSIDKRGSQSSNADLFTEGMSFLNAKWYDESLVEYSVYINSITDVASITIK